MSIHYMAAIVVGLPREAFGDRENLGEWFEDAGFEVFSPYYDGGIEDKAIVGFLVQCTDPYSSAELRPFEKHVKSLINAFSRLTGGMEARVYLTTYST